MRRVLLIDIPARPLNAAVPADEGFSDDTSEGPAEQAALRGESYTNLLLRIDAELKELANWRDPGLLHDTLCG